MKKSFPMDNLLYSSAKMLFSFSKLYFIKWLNGSSGINLNIDPRYNKIYYDMYYNKIHSVAD